MIELNLNLLTIACHTFIAVLIAWALLSDVALSLPKWQRLLISSGAAVLCAQTAVTISGFGGTIAAASNWAAYLKDLSIGVFALGPVAMLLDGGVYLSSALRAHHRHRVHVQTLRNNRLPAFRTPTVFVFFDPL